MKNQPSEIESIVVRCQLGQSDAWEELVCMWHPKLWRFISRMLPDIESAEDTLQNVWLRVIRSLIRLREPKRLNAWIYQIARAAVADRLRKQYRQPPIESLVEPAMVDEGLEQFEQTELIANSLSSLHPADREVVVLYYLEDLSLGEVAEACGIPNGTVKSRLHRARTIMRKAIEKENKPS